MFAVDFEADRRAIVVKGRWRQNRGVNLDEPPLPEPRVKNSRQYMSKAQYGPDLFVSQVQVSLFQQLFLQPRIENVDTRMRLRRNLKRRRADQFYSLRLNLSEVASRFFSFRKNTGNLNSGLERDMLCEIENL